MGAMASQITSPTIAYSTIYSRADQRQHQNSASLTSVWGNHRRPVNSPHKGQVTRKMIPFDDVIMLQSRSQNSNIYSIQRCTKKLLNRSDTRLVWNSTYYNISKHILQYKNLVYINARWGTSTKVKMTACAGATRDGDGILREWLIQMLIGSNELTFAAIVKNMASIWFNMMFFNVEHKWVLC